MHRQADNLARAARALIATPLDGGHGPAIAALDTALLAYDAARAETTRLIAGAVEVSILDTIARISMASDTIVTTVRADTPRRSEDEPARARDVSDLARRIAASVNLLAAVPLDSLETLDSHSDAAAVLAAKVRGMLA